ncbi:MAG: RpoL/Rpb11 RNA polymerase subunit family protein [archaeon]
MELKILKDDKDGLEIEFSETDEGFLNLIKDSVWKQSGVEFAGFKIDHPETSRPVFIIKSKGKKAKDVWNSAVEAVSEELDKFSKELKKIK